MSPADKLVVPGRATVRAPLAPMYDNPNPGSVVTSQRLAGFELDLLKKTLVVVTQLTLTGFIATRLGVIALLVCIPIVMVFGLTVFAAFGTFSVLAGAMVLRRWGEYALIRPGREMLFSKVDRESKYKAKNVCDVAVYRMADAAFAQIKKLLDGIGMGGPAQAMTAAAVAALWAINGWWLGKRFEKEKG